MSKKKLPFTPKKDPMNLKPNIKRIILNEQEFPYDFDKNTVTINDQIFTGIKFNDQELLMINFDKPREFDDDDFIGMYVQYKPDESLIKHIRETKNFDFCEFDKYSAKCYIKHPSSDNLYIEFDFRLETIQDLGKEFDEIDVEPVNRAKRPKFVFKKSKSKIFMKRKSNKRSRRKSKQYKQ